MLWFPLALGAAFFMASTAAYLKRWFSDIPPWEMGLVPVFYAAPMSLIALLCVETPPILPGFLPTLAWLLPVNAVAYLLHMRAIRISPLSLTMPFLSFTPVFVILTGNLLLGERIGLSGIVGIVLVVSGGYVLNLDSARHGLLGPVRAIFREPGSTMMLVVAALYSLTSVGGKMLILRSSPLFAGFLLFTVMGPLLTLLLWALGKADPRVLLRRPLRGLGAGLLLLGDIFCHNLSISLVTAAYMVAVKRMAGIFSVLYGRVIFHERGLLPRLAGTTIMTIGAAVLVLWG